MDVAERPNRVPWPPLLLAGFTAVSAILEAVVPTPGLVPPAAGWVAVALALGLDLSAMATMAREKTNILPHLAAGRLVTHGPFALTRNPIYVGNTLLLAGAGPIAGSLWPPLAALAMAVAVHHLAILREERHLAARFGDAWIRYADRTPRWIGVPRAN